MNINNKKAKRKSKYKIDKKIQYSFPITGNLKPVIGFFHFKGKPRVIPVVTENL